MSYQPIENHGMIGDMHTVALVGTDGSIDWLCVPRFDSPSVFAAILDAGKGGRFKIAPVGDDVTCKQFYWPETNVLITRFLGPHGAAELTDFMPAGRAVSGGKHCLQLIRRSPRFEASSGSAWNAGPLFARWLLRMRPRPTAHGVTRLHHRRHQGCDLGKAHIEYGEVWHLRPSRLATSERSSAKARRVKFATLMAATRPPRRRAA
jgi:hypothetical protein